MNPRQHWPRRHWLRLLTPSTGVRKLLAVFVSLLGLGVCCFAVSFASSPPSMEGSSLSPAALFAFVLVMIVLPLATILLILAAVFEKRNPPRAALWWSACLGILLDAAAFSALLVFWSRSIFPPSRYSCSPISRQYSC